MAGSNRRGKYGEQDAASKLPNGRTVSERGLPGHDVESDPMCLVDATRFEVKLVAEHPKWLQDWQAQAVAEDAILMFRQNRGEWWLAAPLSRWKPQAEVTQELTDLVQLTAEEMSELRQTLQSLLNSLPS